MSDTIIENNRFSVDIQGRVFAALIGDVVDSRSHQDQDRMLGRLREALEVVNQQVPARQPLAPTVGDEFQGLYDDLAGALSANLLLRIHLERDLTVRVGIGQGRVDVLSNAEAPRGQSGPAWWLAREAIDEVHGLKKGWPAGTYSRFRAEEHTLSALVNALLLFQDQIVSRMDDIDRRITIGLLRGNRQVDLAAELEITQSTVSDRQRNNGPAALAKVFDGLRRGLE